MLSLSQLLDSMRKMKDLLGLYLSEMNYFHQEVQCIQAKTYHHYLIEIIFYTSSNSFCFTKSNSSILFTYLSVNSCTFDSNLFISSAELSSFNLEISSMPNLLFD